MRLEARSRRASSSPSSIREQGSPGQFQASGHTPHPVTKVPAVADPQLRSPHVVVAKNPPKGSSSLLWISCLSLFGAPRHKAPSFFLRWMRARGRSILDMRGMRTCCLVMQSWLLGPCRPSYGILTLRKRILCPLRRLWPRRFRERLRSVHTPLLVHTIVNFYLSLPLSCFCRWPPT